MPTSQRGRAVRDKAMIDGMTVSFFPASVYCYYVGMIMIQAKRDQLMKVLILQPDS